MRNWKMFSCSPHWLVIDVVDFSNWDFFKAFKVLVNWTDLLTGESERGYRLTLDVVGHWTLSTDIGNGFCSLLWAILLLAFVCFLWHGSGKAKQCVFPAKSQTCFNLKNGRKTRRSHRMKVPLGKPPPVLVFWKIRANYKVPFTLQIQILSSSWPNVKLSILKRKMVAI